MSQRVSLFKRNLIKLNTLWAATPLVTLVNCREVLVSCSSNLFMTIFTSKCSLYTAMWDRTCFRGSQGVMGCNNPAASMLWCHSNELKACFTSHTGQFECDLIEAKPLDADMLLNLCCPLLLMNPTWLTSSIALTRTGKPRTDTHHETFCFVCLVKDFVSQHT